MAQLLSLYLRGEKVGELIYADLGASVVMLGVQHAIVQELLETSMALSRGGVVTAIGQLEVLEFCPYRGHDLIGRQE